MEEFISTFKPLDFKTEGMSYDFFRELFISGLKYEMHPHVLVACPQTWLEATQRVKETKWIVSSQTRKPSFPPHPKPTNYAPPATPLKIQKLTQAEMAKRQLKGLCYNCDDKYFLKNKCKEQRIFMVVTEDISEEDVVVPPMEELPPPSNLTLPSDPPNVDPVISLNSLNGFFTPQTLKLISYIKNRKFIILMDSGSTHNFIHHQISQEVNRYIRVVNNFQIMIVNGGSMKCARRCENVQLQIGQYHLKYHIFSIDMGGYDIVLGVEWLHTVGPILMDFKDLTMQFQQEGQEYKFQGIIVGSPEIINSHHMEKLLKKGHSVIITQLQSIHVVETPYMHPNLQSIISRHQVVFTTPKEIALSCGVHDYSIPLIPLPRRMKLRKIFMNY
jgi:hypothetical protein